MAISRGVLRFVRLGALSARDGSRTAPAAAMPSAAASIAGAPSAEEAPPFDLDALLDARSPKTIVFAGTEPGFGDIEAAVELVRSGMASRVVLHAFESWPGLLWQSYQLAEAADVVIVPIAVHSGGRVDISVTRNRPIDG